MPAIKGRAIVVGALAVLAACSGDDESRPATSTPTATAASTATTAAPATTPVTAAPATTTSLDPTTTTVPADPLEVSTTAGVVRGADVAAVPGVRAFLGVPYAAPPVGDDRWRPPRPVEPWVEPRDATRPGAACPQPTEGVTAAFTVIPEWDEDCLTLSVWAPGDAIDRPVMVWFHGGGLTSGSAHQPLYIGDQLAGRGVVVVNVNYRIGALGFLATHELAAEGDGAVGNYGLADQAAALRWVADNIEGFGGDPGNVTIFGQSAGGFSVCAHLAAQGSAGLFHRAVVQSGGGCGRLLDEDTAVRAGQEFVTATGCADVACLRALPAEELLAAPFEPSFIADGRTLSTTALDAATAGTPPGVPVLIGSTADEATLFTVGAPEPSGDDLASEAALAADPADVLALYPADEYPTNLARLQALLTDTGFVCPTLAFASAVPEAFVYHYTYVPASDPFGLGATHGAELVLLFGHPEGIRGLDGDFDDATTAVADTIQAAWVRFASTGDPGWPSYGRRGRIMLLDDPPAMTRELRDGRSAALAGLVR